MVLDSVITGSQPQAPLESSTNPQRQVARHRFDQINISGNARVQLGDRYGTQETASTIDQDDDKDGDSEQGNWLSLSVATATIKLSHFATKLVGAEQLTHGEIRRMPFQRIHLDAACQTLTRLWYALQSRMKYTVIKRGADGRSDFPEKVKLYPGDQVIKEAAVECSGIAQDLIAALAQVDMSQEDGYQDARSALQSLVSADVIDDLLSKLSNICWQTILGMLMVVCKEETVPRESFTAFRYDAWERLLLSAVRALQAEDRSSIIDLENTVRSVWFGSQRSGAIRSAALQWMNANTDLFMDWTGSLLARFALESENVIRRQLTASLSFNEIAHRYHGVTPAQARTLNWLFEDSPSAHGSFARWLRNIDSTYDRCYWVRGKPGSGKSTLMRYLTDDPRTRYLASAWSGARPLLIASSFFWAAGTVLQKSQQGLLQTLLHQLLTQYTNFSKTLFPSRWTLLGYGSEDGGTWTPQELRSAIFSFIRLHGNVVRVFFIVDGLDEFQGDYSQRQEVCVLLRELSQSDAVKVCVSSRPWEVYEDNFKDHPQLLLENLTRRDIYNFVEDRFFANLHFTQWSRIEPRGALNLIETIVHRAQGVFLWVRLVVRSLIAGLQNGDDVHDLTRRLEQIPGELEEFFMLMMNRLEPFYLEQASYFFELALTGSHLVMIYHFFQEALEPTDHRLRPSQPLSQEDVHRKQAQQERRIKARCKDLLEFQYDIRGRGVELYTVEFLHRTARDFIASPEIRAKLTSWRNSSLDTQQTLLQALIYTVRTCDAAAPWLSNAERVGYIMQIAQTLKHVHLSSSTTHLLTSTEQDFDGLLSSMLRTHQVGTTTYTRTVYHTPDFLGLVLEEGGYEYALLRLESLSTNDLHSRQGRPLLDFALNSDSGDPKLPSIEVVARLLELGADPHENWNLSSPWGRYLEGLTPRWLARQDVSVLFRHIAIAELLLSAGFLNTVREGGAGAISVSGLRKLVDRAFPPDAATRLNDTLTKTVASARKERYQKRWNGLKRIVS